MVCYYPRKGWRSREVGSSGRRPIVFDPRKGYSDLPIEVPCGSCIGCRLARSQEWAMRCHHEASLYDYNCFVTLTYSPSSLPSPPTVSVRPVQLFLRLRKKYGSGIRFFACGEYGETTRRPHYHLLVFNHHFGDQKFWKYNKRGEPLYTSQSLEQLWEHKGFCSIGAVTFQSAAYVSRYIMKKVTGDQAEEHYQWIDPETGEIHQLSPEFVTMSRRPGIGRGWFERWSSDVYPDDFLTIEGKKMRPPRYYDDLFAEEERKQLDRLKGARKRKAKIHEADNTPERRKVREKVKMSQISTLGREL